MKWTKESIAEVKRYALAEKVIGQDVKLEREGTDLVGRCCLPGHKDDTPSLRINPAKNVWRCHGCSRGGSVVDWVQQMRGCKFPEAIKWLADFSGVPLVEETGGGSLKRNVVASYTYEDADGTPVFHIDRIEPGKQGRSKDILQRLPDGTYKKSDHQVLYRLPEVAQASANNMPVFVVEGEKCVEALRKLNLVATTHAGGASAAKVWQRPGFAHPLKGCNVVMLPDNDEVGRRWMKDVAKQLDRIAKSVTTVRLPVVNEGDDVVDYLASGATMEDLLLLVREAAEAQAPELYDGEWRETLRMGRYGIAASAGNLQIILENDQRLHRLFAFDDFASRVVLTRTPPWPERPSSYPRPIVDADITRLAVFLEGIFEVEFGATTLGAGLASQAERCGYNPLVDELDSFKWDGVPRLSTWLTVYAGAEDNAYTRAVARAWCISAVARAFDPGCKVDTTLVLEGTQGRGKSSLLRALVGKQWFMDHLPDFTSKDAAILVAKAWVHELAELASLSRSEVEKIKQFLTQQIDSYRPPYGANVRDVARKCVFAATTNQNDWARDTTGNRRFWPVKTGEVDPVGIAAVRDQIWAEAIAAYRDGEKWHITDPAVLALCQDEQTSRLQSDPWHETVAKLVEMRYSITTDECLQAVGLDVGQRSPREGERMRGILRALGWWEDRPRNAEGRRLRVWKPPIKADGPELDRSVDRNPVQETSRPEAVSERGPKGPEQNANFSETSKNGTAANAENPKMLDLKVLPIYSGPSVHTSSKEEIKALGSAKNVDRSKPIRSGPAPVQAPVQAETDETVSDMWDGEA